MHTRSRAASLFDEAGSEKGVPRELEAAEIHTRSIDPVTAHPAVAIATPRSIHTYPCDVIVKAWQRKQVVVPKYC